MKKGTKKIITSLSIIAIMAVVVIGATRSYFSDIEKTTGNSITTGTLQIDINGEQRWTGNYSTGDMKPGDEKSFTLQITNGGTLPVRIWQIIKNVTTAENGITEPEQAWYTANSVTDKNDLDSAFDIEMNINGQMVVNKEASFSLSEVKDYYLNLVKLDYGDGVLKNNNDGILDSGETVTVEHKYYFNPAKTGNPLSRCIHQTFSVRRYFSSFAGKAFRQFNTKFFQASDCARVASLR